MKKLTLISIALIICLSTVILAQIQQKAEVQNTPLAEIKGRNKLEQFMLLRDTLFIKEAYKTGNIQLRSPIYPKGEPQYITVFAITIYEPDREEQAARGLLLNCSGYHYAQFYLDLDEAKALSQALDKMIKLYKELSRKKPLPDEFYIKFITHTGLGTELFRSKKKSYAWLELSSYDPSDTGIFYIKKSSDDYKVYPESQLVSQNIITVKLEDIPKLKELIDRGCKFLTSP
ncbi:hypothetical protein DRP07_08405 [Archaeoglobales archaeon]|nr:MAG: hypothetical protein DRP07_08405 [Archaeoglobales archaeon]